MVQPDEADIRERMRSTQIVATSGFTTLVSGALSGEQRVVRNIIISNPRSGLIIDGIAQVVDASGNTVGDRSWRVTLPSPAIAVPSIVLGSWEQKDAITVLDSDARLDARGTESGLNFSANWWIQGRTRGAT